MITLSTPKEQIAIYSTQLVYSTNTSPTFLQILNDIDTRYPNQVASSDKIRWINDTVRETWKWMASTKIYTSTAVDSQAIYPFSTDMRFDKIKTVMVSDSTARSTTELYEEYKPAGMDDELSGDCYYKAGNGFGLYPVPTTDDAGKAIKIIYEPVPPVYSSTTDTTSVPLINIDYADVLKWRPLRDVAGAGNSPDIEMVNNYQANYNEIMKKIKMDYYKRSAKTPKSRWSYKESWWSG